MMFCRWCGKKNVRENALYCPDCGRDVTDCPPPATALSGEQAFCGTCGAANKANFLYCTACGLGMETPVAPERVKDTIVKVTPRVKNPVAILGRGKGEWSAAALGTAAAVGIGLVAAVLIANLIARVSYDSYLGMSFFQPNPFLIWVYTHLPTFCMHISAYMDGSGMGTNFAFQIPLLILLLIPLLSLWIGSLVANRGLERDDWVSRTIQALRMGALYVGLLFIVSLFTKYDAGNTLPMDEIFWGLDSIDLQAVFKFRWYSVLISGLLLAGVCGLLLATGRRGTGRLIESYAGPRWSVVGSGIGQALAVCGLGGIIAVLAVFIYAVYLDDAGYYFREYVSNFQVLLIILPNILIHGLAFGGGAAFEIAGNFPGMEEFITFSIFEHDLFWHWGLLTSSLVLVVGLFWGGYRASRQSDDLPFWQTGLLVAVGCGLVISVLALFAQFRVSVDLSGFSELMYFMDADYTQLYMFMGTRFWPTLVGVTAVGAVAAILGALVGRKK